MSFIIAAGSSLFVGVALGAFGAHGLKETLLASGRVEVWDAAVLYQLLHGLALLAAGIWRRCDPAAESSRALRLAGGCWLAGTVLFSGSLYVLSLGGPAWLGPITPLGGLLFLIGWAALIVAGCTRAPARTSGE
ncbi:MAG: DUF423 domain-containing protein [Opitutaceae bacterium]